MDNAVSPVNPINQYPANNPTQASPVQNSDVMKAVMDEVKKMFPGACSFPTRFEDFVQCPDAQLPPKYKVPDYPKYHGRGNPTAHLRIFCEMSMDVKHDQRLLIHLFPRSLEGEALDWYASLPTGSLRTFTDLSKVFQDRYSVNADIAPTYRDL